MGAAWYAATAEDAPATPPGHLQPFGGWRPGEPIEERNDVPGPKEFYDKYCSVDGGVGKPVVFRGAVSGMDAMKWNTDDYLLQHFGNEKIDGVEYNLIETRAGGHAQNIKTVRAFLDEYNTSDIYMVSKVPKKMARDVSFLPCLHCGGYLKFLDVMNLWMGRGGSSSVIHYDDQDNINCMIDGRKRFVFMHPSYREKFEKHPNTKKNKFGWVDTDLDNTIPGYGAFMRLDAQRMDLIKHPGWVDVRWSYVDLEPGDCVYIPFQWYHQVTAKPGRSINVHIWYWRPERFLENSCAFDGEAMPEGPAPVLADCSWGYEPPDGHLGKVGGKQRKKHTMCQRGGPPPRRRRRRAGADGAEL